MKIPGLFIIVAALSISVLNGQDKASESTDVFAKAFKDQTKFADEYFASIQGIKDPLVRMVTYARKLVEINTELADPEKQITMKPDLADPDGKRLDQFRSADTLHPLLVKHLLAQTERHRLLVTERNGLIGLRNEIHSRMAREAAEMNPEMKESFDKLREAIQSRG